MVDYIDPACGLTLDDHHKIIKKFLPRGKAWPTDNESTLQKFWRAFAQVVKDLQAELAKLRK